MSNFKQRTKTKYIVVHCSASQAKTDLSAADIRRMHMQNGWMDIGYHFVIRRDGSVETGRPEGVVGSHVKGYNSESVGVCLVGGIDSKGRGEFNYTDAQMDALKGVLKALSAIHPEAEILGHRDLDPKKECPCFDVRKWRETEAQHFYEVLSGDSAYRISNTFGIPLETLKELNRLDDKYTIKVGQILIIKP